ncbi:hypothetical protein A9K72_31130 [Mesorhizobium loti]|nr:hypothetical protein A9174_32235 [Mesorhizobium loti NZP2037]OBP77968.1 hypothetical protein BAE41_30925 [Mesorhizobium loti]OBP96979.1 hypothetical protein BAE38_27235 [Mesorhizobium loti]OBQ73557.1 hypothetical protein A9K72_31130 [Mesorhizobium loti]
MVLLLLHDLRITNCMTAEIDQFNILPRLNDRAAHRTGAGEQVEQFLAVAPANRSLQRGQILGNRASISRMASLLCRHTSRHMVCSDAARRVKSRKPEAE